MIRNKRSWVGVAEPFVCGLLLMAVFYLADATMDAVLFDEGSVLGQIFSPTIHELAIRLLAFAVQFLFVLYTWQIFRKRGQLEGALAASREETLRAREFPEAILETISDAISVQTPDFRIIYQNRAHQKLKGAHPGEYCYRAYQGQEQVCGDCHLERVFREGTVATREVAAGGQCVEISSSPLRDGGGRLVGGIEVVRDITDRKRSEEQVRSLNVELERRAGELAAANEEQKAFGYSLSHDLRSPLTRISLAAQGLAELNPASEHERYLLKIITDGCDKMAEMINAMLSLSRISQSALGCESVNLSRIAMEIGASLAWRTGREVELRVADELRGKGDPVMLRMVLENLLENAWKFTRDAAAPRIELGLVERANLPTYFVRDNGVGIDMAEASRLFVPFQRLHADDGFPGIGIGLATVSRIIQRHDGRIWAEGRPGEGTTIYFTLAGGVPGGAVAQPVGAGGDSQPDERLQPLKKKVAG